MATEDMAQNGPEVNEEEIDFEELRRKREAKQRKREAEVREVREVNRHHFVTVINGQTKFCTIQDGQQQPVGFGTYSDFKSRYANKYYGWVDEDGVLRNTSVADTWWQHTGRREHLGGIVTRPGPKGTVPVDPTVYNLWRGWPVKPAEGPWDETAWFLRQIICAGIEEHYQWLLGWMAHCVQEPGSHAETAVTMRGGRGTGKGTFARMFGSFFGSNYLHLSNPVHLTGRFNAHLLGKLCVFLDEAFWAGDVKHEGVLKALISEPVVPIEAKFVDVINMPNVAKILMASNDRWVIPAAGDERRYFMLEPSDEKKQDTTYFRGLWRAWERGEQAALLHYLLERDISEFDHRNPPHTDALNGQKVASFDALQAWWFNRLHDGRLSDAFESNGEWPEVISKDELHADYEAACKKHPRGRYRMDKATLIRDGLPGVWPEVLPTKVKQGGIRVPSLRVPKLEVAREHFAKTLKIPLDQLFPEDPGHPGPTPDR